MHQLVFCPSHATANPDLSEQFWLLWFEWSKPCQMNLSCRWFEETDMSHRWSSVHLAYMHWYTVGKLMMTGKVIPKTLKKAARMYKNLVHEEGKNLLQLTNERIQQHRTEKILTSNARLAFQQLWGSWFPCHYSWLQDVVIRIIIRIDLHIIFSIIT